MVSRGIIKGLPLHSWLWRSLHAHPVAPPPLSKSPWQCHCCPSAKSMPSSSGRVTHGQHTRISRNGMNCIFTLQATPQQQLRADCFSNVPRMFSKRPKPHYPPGSSLQLGKPHLCTDPLLKHLTCIACIGFLKPQQCGGVCWEQCETQLLKRCFLIDRTRGQAVPAVRGDSQASH